MRAPQGWGKGSGGSIDAAGGEGKGGCANVAPLRRDAVIIKTTNFEYDPSQSYIKLAVACKDGMLILMQLNPSAEWNVPLERVRSIHRVLTIGEICGR